MQEENSPAGPRTYGGTSDWSDLAPPAGQAATRPPMRLGLHHFAYLRSLANGLERIGSARRYLGVEHAASAVTMHRQVIERLRALARRRGDRR